ncbi:MAG: Crp/Fnr family transcriptional regulator [Chloroflexi bacterium]|nr:Crp/Fnr family transcriptional regulator [Chloroflexota bacterium]
MPEGDALYAIASHPFFAGLAPEVLSQIRPRLKLRSCGRGEVVILEGQPCQGLYFVQSGHIRIFKSSPEGREQVLRIMGPGDSFNEVPVFDGGPNPASADALEPATLLVWPQEHALALVREYPELAAAILQVFASRLRHLVNLVEDLSFLRVTERIARILLQYASPGKGVAASLTQQQLAALAGTAREMVGRSLRALEGRGAIKVERGRIQILDPKALEEMLQRP